MKKLLSISLAIFALLALMPTATMAQAQQGGATISFNPSGGNIPAGQNFNVDIVVSTGGQNSAGADVTVKFDPTQLEFVSGTYPDSTTFYPNNRVIFPITATTSGEVQMTRTVSTPAGGGQISYTNGTGTFATLTFKTTATMQMGSSTTMSFVYQPNSTSDFTNVANATPPAADLLGSSTLPTATFTVAGAISGPQISGISPASGGHTVATSVTINGSGFGTSTGKVYIGTKLATVISWSDTQIVIEVPAEPGLTASSTRQIKVQRADGQEATFMGFTYQVPLGNTGPNILIWFGVSLMSLAMSLFVYKPTTQAEVMSQVPNFTSLTSTPQIQEAAEEEITNRNINIRF